MGNIICGDLNLKVISAFLRATCNEIKKISCENAELKEGIAEIEEQIYFNELEKEMEDRMPETHELNKFRQKGKPISNMQLYELGINNKNFGMVEKTEELRGNPPNIVIAQCVKDIKFTQNNFREQTLRKKMNYVMSVGVYKALHYDIGSRTRVLKPGRIKFKNVYKPYIGQDLTNKKLLISRTGGIGDLLFIQPSASYLKEKYPTCKITLACGPQYHAMVENWDCFDEVLSLPFTYSKLINSNYHAIFEGVIERCIEAHTTNSYKLFSRWLDLDIPDEKLVPIQKPKEEKVNEVKEVLREWDILDSKFIIVQMRASSLNRTPRPTIWKKIIDHMTQQGYKVIITDSPGHVGEIDNFIENLNQKHMVFNFAKVSKTLDFTIALASMAILAIGPDSSLLHIAASLGTKCMGIYGAFTGNIRLSLYKNTNWIDCKLSCSPCFRHGPHPCQFSVNGFSKCYDQINYNEFFEKIKRLLENE